MEKKQEQKKVEDPTLLPPRKPDYAGDGIAIWQNINKDNQEYLSIRLIGHNTIYAFKKKED